MGPTASGKTTLGKKLYDNLEEKVAKLRLYDGDEIRKLLTKNYSHSLDLLYLNKNQLFFAFHSWSCF